MVVFENNEFEIAMVTYNRSAFVEEWIDKCFEQMRKRNIKFSIYDSSTDDETDGLIAKLRSDGYDIDYIKVPSETPIGYKPMLPILSSSSKYVWVVGDSRYHIFEELDEKVFPHIKNGMDYVLISAGFNDQNDGKVYTEPSGFLRECFISTTCIGLSIYKLSVFDKTKSDADQMRECDRKYKSNYGFGWIGYFFEAFAEGGYKAVFVTAKIRNIFPEKKKQAWATRFYECWVEDLCSLMDHLPDLYSTKSLVPRETWKDMKLDSLHYCYVARISGGLDPESYQRYLDNGMLGRVSKKLDRIRFFAHGEMWKVELAYLPERVKKVSWAIVRSVGKKLLRRDM